MHGTLLLYSLLFLVHPLLTPSVGEEGVEPAVGEAKESKESGGDQVAAETGGGYHGPPPPIPHGPPPPLPHGPPPPLVQHGPPSPLPWPPAKAPDLPAILSLDVKCEKNAMKVYLSFDKPFYGIVFSKGHFGNANCVHLPPGIGRAQAHFEIGVHTCGTAGNAENGFYGFGSESGSGTYFENVVVIQYDPQVQEVWDQARKLRCTWHDQYEKSVTFRPFPVDTLDVVRADFAGDNVGCWMQIQVGRGPWASEVSGLVKIGQTMTMVLAIKDDDAKFDMLVRNCVAHDGKRAPIQLVDHNGCVVRHKLMSRFTKIKNFGSSASVLSYAHFQAFKFPDSMEVHFQCTIQICRYQCPDQCSDAPLEGLRDDRRYKREVGSEVGLNRIIKVVSAGDLTFLLDNSSAPTIVFPGDELRPDDGVICMTTPGFTITLFLLLGVLTASCIVSAFLCCRLKSKVKC